MRPFAPSFRILPLLLLALFCCAPPLMAQGDPDDIYWDSRFGALGIDGSVYASASYGNTIYIGGRFTSVAQIATNNIVSWNRTLFQWDSLGSGLDGDVYAMLRINNDIYVGGNFRHAGGVAANFIARWDLLGKQWHAVGTGTDSTVYALAEKNGELFIGGEFQHAGGIKSSNLVAYNIAATTWRKMLDSLRAPNFSLQATGINTIAFDGDDMYIGGLFEFIDTTATGMPVHAGCAAVRRNGAWRSLIRADWPHPPRFYGFSDRVRKILPYGDLILIGGEFSVVDQDGTSPCNIEQGNIVMNQHGFTAWDKQGEYFHFLPGGGVPGVGCGSSLLRLPGIVNDIVVYRNHVYIAGNIPQAGTTPNTSGFVEWVRDSIYFGAIPTGPLGGLAIGHTFHVFGEELLIGGTFSRAGNVFSRNAVLWNTVSYRPMNAVPDNGADAQVYASMVVNGNLYIGGSFYTAGGKRSHAVARWDGAAWTALDSGVNGTVYALAAKGTDIYIGGAFTLPGSSLTVNVARWDGSRWFAVGAGFDDTVRALAVLGNEIIAGGEFTHNGSLSLNYIARWNGSVWGNIGLSGADGPVYALSTNGSTLHAGGSFNNINGVAARNIAEWNGTAWGPLGTGISNGSVYALAENATTLYAGGDFQNAGPLTSPFLAQWNKGTIGWQTIGNGTKGLCNPVYTLALKGADLYAGGSFITIGDINFNYVGRWDGTRWNTLGTVGGNGVSDEVYTLAVTDSGVYAGGMFSTTSSGYANHVALWNSRQWVQLGEVQSAGLNGPVNALALSPDYVYAGGSFDLAGSTLTPNIVRFSRTNGSWVPMGSGTNGPISALLFHQGKLYAGGQFDQVSGADIYNIAVWDPATEQWSPLGTGAGNGTNGPVHALAAIGNKLYIGGQFSRGPNSFAAHNVVVWDIATGSSSSIGGADSTVTAFGVVADKQRLFVGGSFQNVNSDVSPMRANYIARYRLSDGTWERLGGGMSDPVYAIAALQEDVYVGGPFLLAGTIQPQRIARWDDNVEFWDYLGSGVPGTIRTNVNTVNARGREVFVGGNFQRAGPVPAGLIARWDTLERQWKSLGSGLALEGGGGDVLALASDGQDLWVGGNFTTAGEKGSLFIGRWTKPSPAKAQHTDIEDQVAGLAERSVAGSPWPNPFSDRVTIPLNLRESNWVEVEVLDRTGASIDRIVDRQRLESGPYDVTWLPPSGTASGVYFLRVRIGVETRSFPITLVR